jgi:hypothetical protein
MKEEREGERGREMDRGREIRFFVKEIKKENRNEAQDIYVYG